MIPDPQRILSWRQYVTVWVEFGRFQFAMTNSEEEVTELEDMLANDKNVKSVTISLAELNQPAFTEDDFE